MDPGDEFMKDLKKGSFKNSRGSIAEDVADSMGPIVSKTGKFVFWSSLMTGAVSNIIQIIVWISDLIPDGEITNIIFIGDIYDIFS